MVLNSKWFKYTKVNPENEFDKKGNPRVFEYFDVHSKDYFQSLIKKFDKKSKNSLPHPAYQRGGLPRLYGKN